MNEHFHHAGNCIGCPIFIFGEIGKLEEFTEGLFPHPPVLFNMIALSSSVIEIHELTSLENLLLKGFVLIQQFLNHICSLVPFLQGTETSGSLLHCRNRIFVFWIFLDEFSKCIGCFLHIGHIPRFTKILEVPYPADKTKLLQNLFHLWISLSSKPNFQLVQIGGCSSVIPSTNKFLSFTHYLPHRHISRILTVGMLIEKS